MTVQEHTIAVVEDDLPLGKALARLLSVLGYRVELFASGAEFFQAAPSTKAKLLLVDIDLGATSGLALVRQLSESGFNFATIFMTGSHGDAVEPECRALGALALLRKPFEQHELVQALVAGAASLRAPITRVLTDQTALA
jgi:FixJ family two-component response regulator